MAEPNGILPAARPLDVVAFRNNREVYFAMRDLSQIATAPVAISLAGYFVVAHLDGQHSCAEIQAAFHREFGREIAASEIERVVEDLDRACLLQTDNYERLYNSRRDEYLAADARDSRARWPDTAALRTEIEKTIAAGRAAESKNLRGIVAPHLDYRRGAPCYADSYATLAASRPPARIVILGTNHFGRSTSVVATGKDFMTPLGRAKTDRDFIVSLERRLGCSMRTHEFDHLAEHSVELQVQMLQVCLGERPFEIVPILCPDPTGPSGTRPADGQSPDLADFADALAELATDTDTLLLAGADLSHVGQRFGETTPTTPEFLAEVERGDRLLLELLERGEQDAMLQSVRETGNRTRICSMGCLYVIRRALPGTPFALKRYHQAVEMQDETHVTCASAIFASPYST